MKVADTEGALYPAWSPDSRQIAFVVGSKIKKKDLAGGAAQTICDFPSGNIPFIAWNGDTILFSERDGLRRVSAAGGTPAAVTTLDASRKENLHGSPQFLGDGRRFLYWATSISGKSGLFATSLDAPPSQAGRLIMELSASASPRYVRTRDDGAFLLFERDGALMAQRFDERALALTGEPFHVAGSFTNASPTPVAGSLNGVLVYSAQASGTNVTASQLDWFDRTGKLLGQVAPPGSYGDFALSPDASRLAVSRDDNGNGDIWIVDLVHGGSFSRFTFDPAFDRSPIWSSDGTRIAFTRQGGGRAMPYVKAVNGAQTEQVFANVFGRIADWSMDGRRVVNEANGDIDLVSLEDGKVTPLLHTEFRERQAQLSPNGKWIAYTSDESKSDQVYVQSLSGAGGKWMVSANGGVQPRWRRDGRELFYVAPDRTMMAVEIAASDAFEYGVAKPLFETRILDTSTRNPLSYSVTADGQRFLIQAPTADAQATPVTVKIHWLSGLRK